MTKLDPARTVIERFSTSEVSGVRVVAEITGLDRTSIYKWMKPKAEGGTDGYIRSKHLRKLRAAAEERGIALPAELLIGEEAA